MKELGVGFTIAGKSIYYYNSETFTSLKKTIDHDSFELIAYFEDKTFYFRDKNHVYISSYMCRALFIEGANPKAFYVVDASEGIGYDGKTDSYKGKRI